MEVSGQPFPPTELPKAEHSHRQNDFQPDDWNYYRPKWIQPSEIRDVSLCIFDKSIEEAPCRECQANQDTAPVSTSCLRKIISAASGLHHKRRGFETSGMRRFRNLPGNVVMKGIPTPSDLPEIRIRGIDVFYECQFSGHFGGKFQNRRQGSSLIYQQMMDQSQHQDTIERSAGPMRNAMHSLFCQPQAPGGRPISTTNGNFASWLGCRLPQRVHGIGVGSMATTRAPLRLASRLKCPCCIPHRARFWVTSVKRRSKESLLLGEFLGGVRNAGIHVFRASALRRLRACFTRASLLGRTVDP